MKLTLTAIALLCALAIFSTTGSSSTFEIQTTLVFVTTDENPSLDNCNKSSTLYVGRSGCYDGFLFDLATGKSRRVILDCSGYSDESEPVLFPGGLCFAVERGQHSNGKRRLQSVQYQDDCCHADYTSTFMCAAGYPACTAAPSITTITTIVQDNGINHFRLGRLEAVADNTNGKVTEVYDKVVNKRGFHFGNPTSFYFEYEDGQLCQSVRAQEAVFAEATTPGSPCTNVSKPVITFSKWKYNPNQAGTVTLGRILVVTMTSGQRNRVSWDGRSPQRLAFEIPVNVTTSGWAECSYGQGFCWTNA